MTRGALTTFSIANDVAKYFAIIPAMFAVAFPVLAALNIMRLKTPESAILSAVIFNALIIVALVPLALRGVQYRPMSAEALLRRNLLIYGVGGIIVPFIGIKIIDVIITSAAGWRRELTNMNITRNLIVAVLMTVVTTVLLGVVYPLVVTGLAQVLFPDKANGQLIERNGKIDRLADHRPGVLVARVLPLAAVGGRDRLRRGELGGHEPGADEQEADRRGQGGGRRGAEGESRARRCPIDLVTTSASGLDPHISPAAAAFPGAARGARARRPEADVRRAGRGAHRGPPVRIPRRAGRQRAGAESGARRAVPDEEVAAVCPRTPSSAAESLLARVKEEGRARLRLYIGAAPGVGKTLPDARGRARAQAAGRSTSSSASSSRTAAPTRWRAIGDLEQVPRGRSSTAA